MPLVLEIRRDNERLKNVGWDYFALSCVFTAACAEAAPDHEVDDDYTFGTLPESMWVDFSNAPIYYMDLCPLMTRGVQVLENDHTFRTKEQDGSDRVFELKAGDELRARREFAKPQPPV